MFNMRLKLGPARNEWRCCFCLHVRTATILIGVWNLVLHVLALCVLALIYRNHQADIDQRNWNLDVDPGNFLPTPLSKVKDDRPYYLPTTQDGRPVYSEVYPPEMDMGALMTICTLSLTLLLVYGTIKEKAIYLLPFLCLILFDFIITTLTATSYFCYLRSVQQFVHEHWRWPYHEQILEMSPQYLSLLILLVFLISMLWKAYCVSIVWRCYKFLTLRQQTGRSTVHYILPGGAAGGTPGMGPDGGMDPSRFGVEPDYSTLLPDYDAACASAMKQPPPSYFEAAMAAGMPPSYPEIDIQGMGNVQVVNGTENYPYEIRTTVAVPAVIPTIAASTTTTVVVNAEEPTTVSVQLTPDDDEAAASQPLHATISNADHVESASVSPAAAVVVIVTTEENAATMQQADASAANVSEA